jgi:hypothetical protein
VLCFGVFFLRLCCQFLCILHFWLSLRYSLTFICVIKFVSDLRQVSGFIRVHRFPLAINLTAWRYSWNIVECGVKHHNPNPLFCQITNYHVTRIYKNSPIAEFKHNKDASKQFDLSWWPFNFLMTCKSENVRTYFVILLFYIMSFDGIVHCLIFKWWLNS